MPRSSWKGYLKLSLVSCAVALYNATSASERVSFNTLNRKTGNRLKQQMIDSGTEEPVDPSDRVKGYQFAKGQYVMVEDEDLEALKIDSTKMIDIESFVPESEVDPIYFDGSYYLAPDDAVAEEAFAVIRDAMADAKVVGISRLVMYRRERAVMLEPRGRGIILWTLRYGDEVRDAADYFGDIAADKPDRKAAALMAKLIEEKTRDWNPAMADDPVQERLLEIIAAKKKGRGRKPAPKADKPVETSGNVINIMDALRKSIAGEKKSAK